MEKIEISESTHHPLCPHCNRKLNEIHWHKIKGGSMSMGYVAVYSCPGCRKVLSISATRS